MKIKKKNKFYPIVIESKVDFPSISISLSLCSVEWCY